MIRSNHGINVQAIDIHVPESLAANMIQVHVNLYPARLFHDYF